MKKIDIQAIVPAMVLSVYSGTPGCMCGCNGKHYYNPDRRSEGSRDRGYEVGPDECSPRMIRKVLRLLKEAAPAVTIEEGFRGDVILSMNASSNRVYVAYLKCDSLPELPESV